MREEVSVKLEGVQARGEVGKFGWKRRWVFWEERKGLLIAVCVATFGGAVLGQVLAGWFGLCVALALAAFTFFAGPHAKTRVIREESSE